MSEDLGVYGSDWSQLHFYFYNEQEVLGAYSLSTVCCLVHLSGNFLGILYLRHLINSGCRWVIQQIEAPGRRGRNIMPAGGEGEVSYEQEEWRLCIGE